MKLIPKDWNELQQYKDRKPLWIKLHRELLNDFSYSSVQIGTKATLPLLWLLACEYEDGIINATLEEISFRIHIDKKTIDTAIKELVKCNFFVLDDECTELYETVPREEKRRDREETETEKRQSLNLQIGTKLLEYDNINMNAFDEWIDHKKYKALSPITKLLNMFSKYTLQQQQEMVDKAIMNGWKGLVEPKQQTQPLQSFKQKDKADRKHKVNAYLDSGYSLRDNKEPLEVEVISHDN